MNKGFIVSGYIFGLLLITAAIIFLLYRPMVNNTMVVKRSSDRMMQYVEERNALERMHGQIYVNPMLSGNFYFEDLGVDAVLEMGEGSVRTEKSETATSSGREATLQFVLTADSSVLIEIDYVVAWNEGVQYPAGISRYSFELIHETQGIITIPGVQTTNIVGAIVIEVPSSILPLGQYTLRVIPSRLDVAIETTYQVYESDGQQVLHLIRDGQIIHTVYFD